jgi:hypothetical protein
MVITSTCEICDREYTEEAFLPRDIMVITSTAIRSTFLFSGIDLPMPSLNDSFIIASQLNLG